MSNNKDNTLWLIFLDDEGFGIKINDFLKEYKQNVVKVNSGNSFTKLNENEFILDFKNKQHYDNLFKELKIFGADRLEIIHLGCFTDYHDECLQSNNNHVKDVGFYSLLFIAQSINKLNISYPVNIGIISTQIHEVIGNEVLCPMKSLILGPCGVIPKEFNNIHCFNVDLAQEEYNSYYSNNFLQKLIGEFYYSNSQNIIAYRGKHRWIKEYDKINLTKLKDEYLSSQFFRKDRFKQRGVYLITGGTGGIGLTISKYLAEEFQARLVLTQKSEIPEKDKWENLLKQNTKDNILNQKLNRLIELEKLGAEVVVITAEVSDQEKMKGVINSTINRFGEINGIIHSAGIVNAGIIPAKEKKLIENVFAPKINGTLILYDLVKDMNLDFFVMCSSITSIVTPYAEVDYSAANAFLDTFSNNIISKNKFYTLSINWPGWSEIGQLANLKVQKGTEKWKDEALKKAISSKDGLEAFKFAINSNLAQIIISPDPIENADLENYHSQMLKIIRDSSDLTFTKSIEIKNDFKDTKFDDLESIENELSLLWQEILGVKKINKNDNFFELGGHSLLAIQLVSSIRKIFNVNVDLDVLFDAATFKEMAITIKNNTDKLIP